MSFFRPVIGQLLFSPTLIGWKKTTRNAEPKMLLAIFIRLVELAEIVSNCINLFAHIAN